MGSRRNTNRVGDNRPARLGRVGIPAMVGVTLDASANRYWPSDGEEWLTTSRVSGAPVPSKSWNMQDTSGALAPAVGTYSMASEGSRQAFQQTVSGWDRKAVQSLGDGWGPVVTDANFPDIATSSQMALLYGQQSVAGGTVIGQLWLGDFTQILIVDTDATVKARSGGVDGSNSAFTVTGAVRPFIVQLNLSAGLLYVITDQGYVSRTISGNTGRGLFFTAGVLGDDCYGLGLAEWEGTNAEMSLGTIHSMLRALNWSLSWSPP